MSAASLRLVDEDELADDERRAIGAFIADLYGAKGEPYREAGWRLIRPTVRVLAERDGVLVGHYAAFAPRSDPAFPLVGLGDMAVAVSARRQGIGRAMGDVMIPACWERGAQAMLSATTAMASPIADLGFHPVTRFAYYWEQDGACHRHADWWASERAGAPPRVRLLDPDF